MGNFSEMFWNIEEHASRNPNKTTEMEVVFNVSKEKAKKVRKHLKTMKNQGTTKVKIRTFRGLFTTKFTVKVEAPAYVVRNFLRGVKVATIY